MLRVSHDWQFPTPSYISVNFCFVRIYYLGISEKARH